MTGRDRTVLMVVVGLAVVAAAWFMVLSPKRKEITDTKAQVAAAQQRLDAAKASVAQAQQAKSDYDNDYAAVARLGKAVPVDDNMPSLIYQLQSVAHGSKVGFRSLKMTGSASAPSTPAANVAAAAGSASPSGTSSSTSSGTSSTPSSGASASGTSTTTSSSSTSSSTPATPATPAPATQAAASALPPGATVGAAGFPTMPFTFIFDGSFFDLEKMLGDVDRFIQVKKDAVSVHGRLLSVDGFSLVASPAGFPSITATLSATAYLLPADEGLTPNATSTGPTGTTSTAPSGTTASTGGTAATPTATATGVK